jgi:hypothetical protein
MSDLASESRAASGASAEFESSRAKRVDPVGAAYVLILAIAAAGIGGIVLGLELAIGGSIIGGALLLGAALRAVLSPGRAGLLALRSRGVDVFFLILFGIAVTAASVLMQLRLH